MGKAGLVKEKEGEGGSCHVIDTDDVETEMINVHAHVSAERGCGEKKLAHVSAAFPNPVSNDAASRTAASQRRTRCISFRWTLVAVAKAPQRARWALPAWTEPWIHPARCERAGASCIFITALTSRLPVQERGRLEFVGFVH